MSRIAFYKTIVALRIFTFLKGCNPFFVYLHNWPWFILSLMSVSIMINCQILITIMSKSYVLATVTSFAFTVFAPLLDAFNLSIINPWGYTNYLFGYKSFNSMQFILIILISLCKNKS